MSHYVMYKALLLQVLLQVLHGAQQAPVCVVVVVVGQIYDVDRDMVAC
jgi:hypothetical protein